MTFDKVVHFIQWTCVNSELPELQVFDQVCSQNDWILALFFFVRVCLQTKIVFRHKITIFMRETADNPSG